MIAKLNGKELKRLVEVIVKKDQPAVQREGWRLNNVVKQEKAKAGNEGSDIRLDYKTRQITGNGIVLDS